MIAFFGPSLFYAAGCHQPSVFLSTDQGLKKKKSPTFAFVYFSGCDKLWIAELRPSFML
jgi:hypothetical protein